MIYKQKLGGIMDDIKALIENLLSDIKNVDKKTIKRTIQKDNIKANININLAEKSDGYYVSKLRLPANMLDVPSQVKSLSLKLYINFAKIISKKFKGTMTTSHYHQIYALARDYIEDFIDPYYESEEDRIIRSLYRLTNLDFSQILKKEVADFLEDIPKLNEDTVDYYNLATNGKPKVFWDQDGSLREKYAFKKDEEKALSQLSPRNNVLWSNDLLKALTINLYLKSLKEAFLDDKLDTDILKTYTKPYTLSKKLLDSLLIITEANVREKFSFLTDIKTENSIEILRENKCDDILDFFMTYQVEFLNNLDDLKIEEIYISYIKDNPNKSNDIAAFIGSLNINRQEEILLSFKDRENFVDILNSLLGDSFTPTRILALFYIYKFANPKPRHQKVLFEIIRPENYENFIELVETRDFDLNLLEEILDLKNIQAKKISLDKKMIKKSRSELTNTVNTLNEFMGESEDENEKEIQKENEVKEIKLSKRTSDFLKIILKNSFISKEEAEKVALDEGLFLNVYINEINNELYPYINDQSLIIEENKIVIDDFYIDMVKELLDE